MGQLIVGREMSAAPRAPPVSTRGDFGRSMTGWQDDQHGRSARPQQARRRSVLMYAESLNEARTKLTAIFTILLGRDAAGQDEFAYMIQPFDMFIGRPRVRGH